VLYQALSVATLLVFHDQLQPHRAVTMMWAAFGAAVPVTLAAFGPRWPRVPRAATAALAAVAIFALGAAQGTDLASGPLAAAAHVRPDVARAGAMTRFITQTTGKRPAQLTVLTSYHLLLITQPFYGFLPLRARYAHPEADVAARLEVIETAGACRTPACATRALTTSRFGAVDAAVLGRTPSGYQMEADEDAFPRRRTFILAFRPENFDPAVWAKRAFGRYTVFARRPGH
jgi:hypothetical protein